MSSEFKLGAAVLYAAGHFFVFAFHWVMILYLPVYFQQCGMSDGVIGAVISLFSLATIIIMFPLGALADRLNPKSLFIAGAGCALIFSIIMPQAHALWAVCMIMLIGGGAISMMLISISALFIKQMGVQKRGAQVAVFNIGSVLGAGLGGYLCGFLVQSTNNVSILFKLGMAFGAGAIILGFILPGIRGIPFSILEYKQDMKHAWMWVLIFVVACTASHAGFEHAGYTLLQTDVLGLDAEQVGRAFLYISFWMALVTLLAGKMHDRLSKPVIMLGVSMIISGIFQAASGYADGFNQFVAIRFLHTFGDSFSTLLVPVVAATIFPGHRIGGTYAFILAVNTSSYFLFANVAGMVNQTQGFVDSFVLSGAILLAAGLITIFIIRPWLKSKKSSFHS